MSNIVYLDECGFTGKDLLNVDQPYFVNASLNIAEEEAVRIKAEYFSGVIADELKFKKLQKHHSRQQMIVKYVEYLMANPHLFKVSVTNKRYALLCKLIDTIVETAMHKHGENAYQDGFNIALANMMWYTIPAFHGAEFLGRMLARFQMFGHQQSQENFEKFFLILQDVKLQDKDPLDFVALSERTLTFDDVEVIGLDLLDITASVFLVLIKQWSDHFNGDVEIIHDESSKLHEMESIWSRLLITDNQDVEQVAESSNLHYPIQVKKVSFGNSSELIGLQLTDLLAGVVSKYIASKDRGNVGNSMFMQRLGVILDDKLGGHCILPSPKVTPSDLGMEGKDGNKTLMEAIEILRK